MHSFDFSIKFSIAMKMKNILPENEEFLIFQLKKGNVDSYEFLFHRYYPTYFHFAKGMLKDEAAAEDIMQNVFMKIWTYRERLDETMSMKNYIYVLAKREILNHFRAKYNTLVVLTDEEKSLDVLHDGENSDIDYNELKKTLRDILEQLPARQREIFYLSRFKAMSNKEIAEKLDISVRTVEKHIQMAIRTFREQLGDLSMLMGLLAFIRLI